MEMWSHFCVYCRPCSSTLCAIVMKPNPNPPQNIDFLQVFIWTWLWESP